MKKYRLLIQTLLGTPGTVLDSESLGDSNRIKQLIDKGIVELVVEKEVQKKGGSKIKDASPKKAEVK